MQSQSKAVQQKDLAVGQTYLVKLTSGKWVRAAFLTEITLGGFKAPARLFAPERHIRKRTRYEFRNIGTGRTISLRSLRKVREIEGGAL